MADCRLIHKGHTPSQRLEDLRESLGWSPDYHTAKFGAAATDDGTVPDVVLTDAPDVADYWQERGVDVRMPSQLPEWMPRAGALAESGLETVEEVATAVLSGEVEDVQGIGPATTQKIRDALESNGHL